jgi:PAS domain S-box-containing protein
VGTSAEDRRVLPSSLRPEVVDRTTTPAPVEARVLLVDDHAANLLALEAILAPLGHELVKASSGEEALRQILKREFALVLLDVQMAGMSGFETAGLLKQHPRTRHVPIIFITAVNRDAENVFRGYSQGAVDYLVKPFDPDILRSKAMVFVDLYIKGETIKAQERMLREQEREVMRRRSEERYRDLLDAMPQCVWAADAEGRVNYWNQAGLAYFGLTHGDINEAAFWECIHPEDRAPARAQWDQGIHGDQPFERQVRLRRASDGSHRWHLARAVPERGEDGAITGWIASATDIDDQKRGEEALRHAIVLRDDFLSVASHELRTPLTSLKLEVSNLARMLRKLESERDPEAAAKLASTLMAKVGGKVERIDTQANRLHRLIDDLLDVSRLGSGHLELQIEEVDLAQVAREVGGRFADEAARLGCALNVSAPEHAVGQWDRSRLDQVITNLISNAVKYGQRQPVDLVVELDEPGKRARLVVRDRGLGIAPGDQERIFGRFERAASSRHYGGIGLGLWIVKQIVEALGGSVTVDSQPSAGSKFTIDLPCERAGEPAREPAD